MQWFLATLRFGLDVMCLIFQVWLRGLFLLMQCLPYSKLWTAIQPVPQLWPRVAWLWGMSAGLVSPWEGGGGMSPVEEYWLVIFSFWLEIPLPTFPHTQLDRIQ
jgi:hypothetical protein